jgi:hypothetical protein
MGENLRENLLADTSRPGTGIFAFYTSIGKRLWGEDSIWVCGGRYMLLH